MRIESSITTVGPMARERGDLKNSMDVDDTTSTDSSTESSSESSSEEERENHEMARFHDPSQCEDCKRREHVALLDSLPPSVVTGELNYG